MKKRLALFVTLALTAACWTMSAHAEETIAEEDIYVGITHGVFSRNAIEKIELSPIKEMVIADTIPLSDEKKDKSTKITVLSVASMIAMTIDAIKNHTPVSHVYDKYKYDSYK